MKNIKESDLYEPVAQLLREKGYEVHGEVKHCDIVAKKDGDIVAIELKKQINLKLLTQAVEKKEITDSVYIAVIKPKGYKRSKSYHKLIKLVKALELGLIFVNFLSYNTEVFVEFHPIEREVKKRQYKQKALLKEIDNRMFNVNKGGVTRVKTMTAYREENIRIACILEQFEELPIKKVKSYGASDKAGNILYSNFYEWFERRGRGVYALSKRGHEEIQEFSEVYTYYKTQTLEKISEVED